MILGGMSRPEETPLPTYEECIERAARVYADWLAEREARMQLEAAQ